MIATYPVATLPGTADASRSQSIEAAIQQRDSDIKAYFDTHLLKHVLNPDHQKRALALTREICGLKVAHQQLIAAHAAAKKVAVSASLQGVTLRRQLQVCKPLHLCVGIALIVADAMVCTLISVLLPRHWSGLRLCKASPSKHSCTQALARMLRASSLRVPVYMHVYAYEHVVTCSPLHVQGSF